MQYERIYYSIIVCCSCSCFQQRVSTYGTDWKTPRPMRIAVVEWSAGYSNYTWGRIEPLNTRGLVQDGTTGQPYRHIDHEPHHTNELNRSRRKIITMETVSKVAVKVISTTYKNTTSVLEHCVNDMSASWSVRHKYFEATCFQLISWSHKSSLLCIYK
jgi:hypothetical protein